MKGFLELLDITYLPARSYVVTTKHDSRVVPQDKSDYEAGETEEESAKAASNFWFAKLSEDKPFVVLRTNTVGNASKGESRPCTACSRFGDSCETTGRSLTLYKFNDKTTGHLEPCCDTVSPRFKSVVKSVVWRNELIGAPYFSAAWTGSDYGLPAYRQTRLCTSCSSRPRSRAGCSCYRWIGLQKPVDDTHHNLKGYILDEGCRAENLLLHLIADP
jgi:hypothetical protein